MMKIRDLQEALERYASMYGDHITVKINESHILESSRVSTPSGSCINFTSFTEDELYKKEQDYWSLQDEYDELEYTIRDLESRLDLKDKEIEKLKNLKKD